MNKEKQPKLPEKLEIKENLGGTLLVYKIYLNDIVDVVKTLNSNGIDDVRIRVKGERKLEIDSIEKIEELMVEDFDEIEQIEITADSVKFRLGVYNKCTGLSITIEDVNFKYREMYYEVMRIVTRNNSEISIIKYKLIIFLLNKLNNKIINQYKEEYKEKRKKKIKEVITLVGVITGIVTGIISVIVLKL